MRKNIHVFVVLILILFTSGGASAMREANCGDIRNAMEDAINDNDYDAYVILEAIYCDMNCY